MAEFVAVAFTASAGLAILRSNLLPRWLGWVSLVLALILIISPIGWAALYLGIPLWALVIGIWLMTQSPAVHTA